MRFRIVHLGLLQISLIAILLPFNNCGKGFSVQEIQSSSLAPTADDGISDLSVIGKTVYARSCAGCHGDVDSSTKKDRTYEQIMTAINTIDAMKGLKLSVTSDQITALVAALRSPTSTDGRLKYTCDPSKAPKSVIQRLSNRELKNTVLAILNELDGASAGDSSLNQILNSLPSDIVSQKESTLLLTSNLVTEHFNLAYRLGEIFSTSAALKQNFPGTSGCLTVATISSSCADSFIRELGLRAFRRPLTTTESTAFKNIFSDASATSNSEKILLTTSAVFMAPDFHYQIYDRGLTESTAQNIKLSAYEFASRMSYLLTGSPPDITLRNLASNGTILQNDIALAQIQRLMGSSKGKENIVRFFREWLHYDKFETFNYSGQVLNGQSLTNLQPAMIKEIDDFVSDLTLNSNGTYENLLLSPQTYITENALAQLYGITNPNGATSLPGQERAGLLTRAALLSKRSGALTSPVKRGLFIKEALLCESVGTPPPNAPTMLDPLPEGTFLTTRERLTHLTQQNGTSCIACHSMMNNLGYPLEMYDTMGRYRQKEKIFLATGAFSGVSLDVNTTAEVKDLGANPKMISNALNLSQELANNDKALACFSKKWTAFQLRRTPAATEGCMMNNTLQIIYGSSNKQGSIQDVIKGTILSDEFKKWNY